MTAAIAALAVLGLLAAPHLLRLDDGPPMPAAAAWLGALALRAVLVVSAAVAAALVLPSTGLYHAITHWCWEVLAGSALLRDGVSGHVVGAVVLTVPIAGLAASMALTAVELGRSGRAARRLLQGALPGGPGGSLIVPDDRILIAAAGLWRPAVVVSAGALTRLDDGELYAGLAHEQGHIRRRHRWLLVAGWLFLALGRPLPGARHAHEEVAFHLERDADRYAIAREHEPLDLVSAIWQAAAGAGGDSTLLALGGGGACRRVEQLIQPPPARPPGAPRLLVGASLVAALLAVAALSLSAVAPASGRQPIPDRHCVDRDAR